MSTYFHPVKFFLCKGIVGFFVELFALGQVTLGKFTSAGQVPDLNMIFIFRFAYATTNGLYNSNKTFTRLNKHQIKNCLLYTSDAADE